MKPRIAALTCVLSGALAPVASAVIVVDFETAQVGQLVNQWVEQDIVFTSTFMPDGLLTFHTHSSTGHMGIFNALADIDAPVQATFPFDASSVTVIFWGSAGNTAFLEAFDNGGVLVNQASMPVPQDIGQPAVLFNLTVSAPEIAYIQFHGATPNGFITADEVHITPVPAPGVLAALAAAGLARPGRRRRDA